MDGKVKGKRVDLLPKDNPLQTLPEVKALPHVLNALLEMGPMSVTPMGNCPRDWKDIKAYCDLMRVELAPNEISIMMECSVAYTAQYQLSKDELCRAPFLSDEEETNEDRGANIKAAMQRFKKARR